jgi:hypothetical protein
VRRGAQIRRRTQPLLGLILLLSIHPYVNKRSFKDLPFLCLFNACIKYIYFSLNTIKLKITLQSLLFIKRQNLWVINTPINPSSFMFTIFSFSIYLTYIFSKSIFLKYHCTFSFYKYIYLRILESIHLPYETFYKY